MGKHHQYHKTLFLAGLYGQYKLWKNEITGYCNRSEEIVQFGNLIGCNDFVKDKDTFGANETLLKFIVLYRSTESNWIQLIGPNEIAALNFPENWTNRTSRQLLRSAWLSDEPTMQVSSVHEGRLLTHGGLTYGEWVSIGRPESAVEASKRLNEKYAGTLYQGPSYALGNRPNYSANPIWCDPIMELYPSWLTTSEKIPFPQIHSGRNLNTDLGRAHLSDEKSVYQFLDSVKFRTYGSISRLDETEIIGLNFPIEGKMLVTIPRPYSIYLEKRIVEE